jgi:hypothetical protein
VSIGGKVFILGGALSTTGSDTVVLAMPSTGTPTYTFPSASATLATLGANTFAGAQFVNEAGTASAPALAFNASNTGLYAATSNNQIALTWAGSPFVSFDSAANGGVVVPSNGFYAFSSGGVPTSSFNTFINSNGAGEIQVGTTTTGSNGSIAAATFTASTQLTIGAGSAITSSGAGGSLGTAAFASTGTSGGTVPLLNSSPTFSGTPTFSAATLFTNNGFPSLSAGQSSVSADSNNGLILGGRGTSTNADVAFYSYSGGSQLAAFIPQGTKNVNIQGQLIVPNMTQSATAQSGTVCYASGGLTYDATLGCLSSDERLKNIGPRISGAINEAMKLQPFIGQWKTDTLRAKTDPGDHLMLGAWATAYVDERLIARDSLGNPRGVRYQDALPTLLLAAIQDQQREIQEQNIEIKTLQKIVQNLR